MMAGATSATAAADAFAASACPRVVAAGGRRRCGVVRCDADGGAQAVAMAASIAALEQFKISADRTPLLHDMLKVERQISRADLLGSIAQ